MLRELGRGGMGVVYEALQPELDRSIALKILPAAVAEDDARVAAFRQEALTAARVRHPGLVHVHDAGVADGRPFLAMECVDGRGLDDLVAEAPLTADEAVRVVAEVAHAVDALHAAGIVHRDLKPSNVLIDSDGRARVTDFGVAQVCGDVGHGERSIVGTPGFMPPEQIGAAPGESQPTADVWSLGAMLFQLLSGEPVFVRQNTVDVLYATLEETPRSLRVADPRVPWPLEAIVRRCLQRDPRDRYPTAGALADDLERYLRDEAITAPMAGAVQRAVNFARLRPTLVVHLAAIFGLWSVAVFDSFVVGGTTTDEFRSMSIVAVVLIALSFVFDRVALRRGRCGVIELQVLVDAAGLAGIAAIGDGPSSAAVPGFALLVVGAGLWGRERPVIAATVGALVAYGALVVTAAEVESVRIATALIFVVVLLLSGAVTTRIVRQSRLLRELAGHNRPTRS